MASMRTRKRRAVHSRIARLHIKCVLMVKRNPGRLQKLFYAVTGDTSVNLLPWARMPAYVPLTAAHQATKNAEAKPDGAA